MAEGTFDGVAQGELRLEQLAQLLAAVAGASVVGLGIAEHHRCMKTCVQSFH
jgi:hypothetical protein